MTVPSLSASRLDPLIGGESSAVALDREWFLMGCRWEDSVWVLRPANVLDEKSPVRLHWGFPMPGGDNFTDPRHASLLQTCRTVVRLSRERSPMTGLPQKPSSIATHFYHLKALVYWMVDAGYSRFSDIDRYGALEFLHQVTKRKGAGGRAISPITVEKYLHVLMYFYWYRRHLDDGLMRDPFAGGSPALEAGVHGAVRSPWPHTPDGIAAELVTKAIGLLEDGADRILRARRAYADALAEAEQAGYAMKSARVVAARAISKVDAAATGALARMRSTKQLAKAINLLYAACFIVISYLVGARASEILHLQFGCVARRGPDEAVPVIVGAIFKRQMEYHGRPHEWVAPPPVITAIEVLEALSEGHRVRTNRRELWLRQEDFGATEWKATSVADVEVIPTHRMRRILWRFVVWADLSSLDGKSWKAGTHQGRKTFARFAALRDRTALLALAQQLGHRDRAVTDFSYAGSDHRLLREIEEEVIEQSTIAWQNMLVVPKLGGKAGAEIVARRPTFKGSRLKEDVESFARLLVDAGLSLAVCDWGFCVYREEHSACAGNARGPNPARREPSTCARCKNFVLSEQHRPYWSEQILRHETLLNEPGLPWQTIKIVRSRLDEARTLLQSLEPSASNGEHGEHQ